MKSLKNISIQYCTFILFACFMCNTTVHANEQKEQNFEQTVDSLYAYQKQDVQIEQLLHTQEVFETRYYLSIGIVLLLVLIFGLLCARKTKGYNHLKKIIELLEKNKQNTGSDDKKSNETYIEINETIVNSILENLQAFERERGFLISKITLHQFAKQLKTNTKYLSKVINTYKLKSFRNYINDLRIQHSLQELENNTNYRKYTVKAMAKESGFGTTESFSKAFQKNTGETVSSFLRQF
ncbi:hypothetical protein IMCC3317_27610 [Kordia antarctica]|uniref:HTH araC/xylS-type domain-containing protein n=1 Tax=Kordia antarctica TaxID=1218801 RepID=A0A7L4ZL90_9FLAO|nr:helix-turn-helix domain-containing protein [Kordia antarctica]QHI37382.1 hypothetical protein IMCC3317_27610 [Kordia antarctica]